MSNEHITVVGAGVSGLYAAWRLLEAGHDPAKLTILEATDRIGGRLWSLHMLPESDLPAELGGMFFNDQQPLVYGLCGTVFDLPRETIEPQPDFAWLRATRFKIEQFADLKVQPYNLAPDEQGLSYYQLLDLACTRIAPGIKTMWPSDPSGTREQTLEYLKQHEFDGRPLWRWGYWNLLSRVISHEAWEALRDLTGIYAMFSNWNAFDAMVSIVLEQSGKWYRLKHGYQHLPLTLAEKLESAGVAIRKRNVLERIETAGSRLKLEVKTPEGSVESSADRVVLAIPKLPIKRLIDNSPSLREGALAARVDSVDGAPACKIFLTFDKPWWRDVPDGPGRIERGTYGVSHTDLPMRQCYYLGVDHATGQALMMASYADTDAVSFWRALTPGSGRGPKLQSELSDVAMTEICRELSEMHGTDVPKPTAGRFIDWTPWPYGGGWHSWLPGWKSWEETEAMAAPVPGMPLHICGETYSTAQGWSEGALQSAEDMLRRQFGLKAPEWLNPKT
jgi:monoamine oxidase